MAKYAIDSDTLTGIADAIRSKTDSTSRIRVNQMASKILNIPQVEGGELKGVSIATGGSLTPASDLTGIQTFAHDLGQVPDFCFLYADGTSVNYADFSGYLCDVYHVNRQMIGGSKTNAGYTTFSYVAEGGTDFTRSNSTQVSMADTETEFTLYLGTRKLKAGVTYHWVCGQYENMH